MESPIWAIPEKVEFCLEALGGRVSNDLRSNLMSQIVAGLLVRENIDLVALLETEFANGDVSPPSHSATSTVEVKLGPNISVVVWLLRLGMLLTI